MKIPDVAMFQSSLNTNLLNSGFDFDLFKNYIYVLYERNICKRETTSKFITQSVGLNVNNLSLSRNSHVLDDMTLDGICGLIIWSRYFAILYSAGTIIETTGLNG